MRRKHNAVAVTVSSDDEIEMTALTSRGGFPFFNFSRLADGLDKCTIEEAVRTGRYDKLETLMESSLGSDVKEKIMSHLLLHEAIEKKSVRILRLLLEKVNDKAEILFLKDGDGKTALHLAIQKRSQECSEALMISSSATLIQPDNDGENPIHYIAKTRFVGACEKAMLYATPKDINIANKKNCTALHLAARENNTSILKMLLNNGGNPEAKTQHGYTALHFAADLGFNECVKVLVSSVIPDRQKAYMNLRTKDDSTALILASKKGFSACCKLLKLTNVDVQDKTGFTALHYAAGKGYLSIVKFLIEELHANITIKNKGHQTPLYFAASSFNEGCLTYLLDKTTVTETPEDLLRVATEKNCTRALIVLLQQENIKSCINNPLSDENTVLHLSLKKGNYKITRILLENGACKNKRNKKLEYPLHLAAEQKSLESRSSEEERLEVCKEILKESHDLANTTNVNNESPLHLAAKSGNEEMIRSLLRKGSKVLSVESNGHTAIHVAARYGNSNVIKMLMRSLNINQTKEITKFKPHPLHLAAQHGHLDSCKTLVKEFKLAKKLFIEDDDESYPVDLAYLRKRIDVFRYLLSEMPFDANMVKFSCRIHSYCKKSIRDKNIEVLDAIIGSAWCKVALDGFFCSGLRQPIRNAKEVHAVEAHVRPCESFGILIKYFPQQACRAMDQHITLSKDNQYEVFDYVPFEFIYYNVQDDQIQPVFGRTTQKAATVGGMPSNSLGVTPINSPGGASPNTSGRLTPTSPDQVFGFSPPNSPGFSSLSHANALGNTNKPNKPAADGSGAADPDVGADASEDRFRVVPQAKEFAGVVWGRSHPLLEASEAENTDVLNHRLTRSWLENKFTLYARWLLCGYVIIDFLTASFTSLMFALLWNTYALQTHFNGTTRSDIAAVHSTLYGWQGMNETVRWMEEEVRNASFSNSQCTGFVDASVAGEDIFPSPYSIQPGSAVWNRSVCAISHMEKGTYSIIALQGIVMLIFIFHLCMECYFKFKVRIKWYKSFNVTRYLRLFCLPVVLISSTFSDFFFGMRQNILWQCGVMSVLLTWLNLVSSLNKVPAFTVFMPVTSKFVWNYLKVIMHIVIIILAFALSFHFLLNVEEPAFRTLPYALIKTLVWMLGDLGYNDTFLQEDSPLNYPVQANILFVLFVTTIGGLIFNLILRDPTDQLQDIKDKAGFYQADAYLKLHLLVDECAPNLRRNHAMKQKTIRLFNAEKRSSVFYSRMPSVRLKDSQSDVAAKCCLQHLDKAVDEDTQADIREQLKLLIQKIDCQKEDINELTRKITNFKK